MCYVILVFGCSKSEDVILQNPTAAKLVFPFENSLCNVGTDVTDSQSKVLFEWKPGNYTDSYKVVIKNGFNDNETTYNTTNTEIAIVLNRATPYQWHVISESDAVNQTAQSEIWQFYNAGQGIQSYAPFSAMLYYPAMAEKISNVSEVTLKWTGNDLDNDIVGYDIYFSKENDPTIFFNNLNANELMVPVTPNTIYFWKVITKDALGNTSVSSIYQFEML